MTAQKRQTSQLMNSNVHPLVVALVLVLTALAVGTWVWGSGEAASIGGPAELMADADGHAYIQIQDKLIEHDAHGRYLRTHDLKNLGIDLFLGSFDFFSNGDILLRRGTDPRSVWDNIRAFQRHSNTQSIEPESPESGLFRCQLDTQHCTRFGQRGVDFKATHGIAIDRSADDVYISDTTRDVLRKYSGDGTAVAGPVAGFRFPNQVLIFGEKLFVADTNHHEIRIVAPSTSSFGKELRRIDVTPRQAVAAGQNWPSHFARVGDGWWVNNMRTGMNEGGIYRFDGDWRPTRKLDLPEDADPIALLAVGDEVWISDWNNDKVRRFSTTGEPLADLESSGLVEILASARTERWKYTLISYAGIALVLLVLAGLALRGYAVEMSAGPARPAHDPGPARPSPEPVLHLEPDNKKLQRIARVIGIIVLAFLALTAATGYLIMFYLKPEIGLQFMLPVAGITIIVVLAGWIIRANADTAIHIDGDVVTLREHSGRESSAPLDEVRYTDMAIATRDAVVFLGRPSESLYNREDLDEKLFPRLVRARKVSELQMQKILIQQRHPQGITVALSVLGLLIYAVWALHSA